MNARKRDFVPVKSFFYRQEVKGALTMRPDGLDRIQISRPGLLSATFADAAPLPRLRAAAISSVTSLYSAQRVKPSESLFLAESGLGCSLGAGGAQTLKDDYD